MDMQKINQIREIINGLGGKIATVKFTKKDGSDRVMQIQKSQALLDEIKGTQPEATEARKWTLNQNGMACVQELTKDKGHQWRTINMNTVYEISANGHTLTYSR